MLRFFRHLADNSAANSLANQLRRKRYQTFLLLTRSLARPLRILDIGGEENFWRQMGVTEKDGFEITLVNLIAQTTSLPFISSIVGDAKDLSQFPDRSFDLVFSNSVLEHVGDFKDQKRMAAEIQRLGKSYFVQTPARHFPLEPHFLFPFFGVLPHTVRLFLVQHFNLGWYKKIPVREQAEEFLRSFQLLDRRQMCQLFPDGELKAEKFLGLTKSFICMRKS